MMTMTWPDMSDRKTNHRHATSLPKIRAARDLVADWKRWTLAERIIAAAMLPAVLLTVLAMSTTFASGGH